MKIFHTVFVSLFAIVCFSACSQPDSDETEPAPTQDPTPTIVNTEQELIIGATNPLDNDISVFINRKITATFNREINSDTATADTFSVTQGVDTISGVVTVNGKVATFTPDVILTAATLYTVTITDGIKDLAGEELVAGKTWSFTTGSTSDTIAPTVDTREPLDGATDISLNRYVSAIFSESLDASTISGTTFTLMNGNTPVPGTVSFGGTVATFVPTSNFEINTLYTAKISTEVKDLAGNSLAEDKIWDFTTGTAVSAGPQPVLLGTSAQFAILSKAGITNVPTSAITGDIGTSPITGASIDGLCDQITGIIYTVDATGPECRQTNSVYLSTAVSDMEIAYTDAAGRTSPQTTELNGGELGGLTIAPGLHKWGTNVLISTDVILSGGANDVWIFQISGDLTQANGMNVTLEGGALAKNIFWQVSGQVEIGTTAHFAGTVLSRTLIALKTGATLSGRALAQTAVTLESNVITKP